MNMASIIREATELYPEKDALVDGRQNYTFHDLERLSTNFATFLLSSDVQKGDRIAFCLPKSASVIVAILGCLKCGAAYVPIDRKLPKERLLFILKDVSPRFIVSSRAFYDALAEDGVTPGSLLDEASLAEHFQYSQEDISLPPITDEDVAYCIYTSGSTGRPKGVLIEHGSVDFFYDALAEVMTIDAGSRCMNTSELHFDVHVMDLFFPLSRGATVHLTRPPLIANNLLQLLARERITHFTAVGPVMTLMTEGTLFEKCDLSSLRRIMTGAEIINVETMQKWLRKVPGLSLVNGYGPTEATVICTAYIIDQIEPHRTEFYPIGKPMKGTEVLLQDKDRIVSKPGVKGELLLGGRQVMKGYWNDERQTNAKIINIEGTRYYKSGDICRWLPDGNLDYIGRVDEEIKLSGFRINLSEIKRVMDATESVKEGHPVVAIHPTLGKVIAACFIRADDEPVDEKIFGHLQSVFKHELPYYMIPSLYFLFNRFPQLSSGKTDKRQILQKVDQYLHNAGAGTTRFICYEEAMSG
jgi:amino acid adenylation domain-containing protein